MRHRESCMAAGRQKCANKSEPWDTLRSRPHAIPERTSPTSSLSGLPIVTQRRCEHLSIGSTGLVPLSISVFETSPHIAKKNTQAKPKLLILFCVVVLY